MKFKLQQLVLVLVCLCISCTNDDDSTTTNQDINDLVQTKPNILLIIADDMGLDASPGYSLGSIKPNMPNLHGMINSGVTFNNLWSNPTCTPTRSSIITGKYGFRTGVTKVDDVLPTSEIGLQKTLDNNASGYSHAVIGKWHLSSDVNHPTQMGVGYYAGLLNGGVQSYLNWNLTENGQTNNSMEYTTSKFTDLAIDWVDNQSSSWFLWLAYNAPHTPFHLPPLELHSQGNLPTDDASIDANPVPYYMAMLEAMDTEIGTLLDSMTEEKRNNTIIIFIGDNGTPGQVVQDYNSNRAKGSVYQGGINVPMIISGKGVSRFGQTENALVNTTDLFATILDIAGLQNTDVNDSKSFKDMLSNSSITTRDYVFSQKEEDSGDSDFAIRNATHKYILFDDGSEALYDLSQNPLEFPNLMSQNQLPLSVTDEAIKNELAIALSSILQ